MYEEYGEVSVIGYLYTSSTNVWDQVRGRIKRVHLLARILLLSVPLVPSFSDIEGDTFLSRLNRF